MWILAVLILLVVMCSYLRILWKRAAAWRKLCCFCGKNELPLYKTRPFCFWSANRAGRCDCYIETDKMLYAIKFFSVKRKRDTLIFTSDGQYFLRKKWILFGTWSSLAFERETKKKAFVDYDFGYRMPVSGYAKAVTPILLISPICIEMKIKDGKKEETLGAGDAVYGVSLYSTTRILEEIGYACGQEEKETF